MKEGCVMMFGWLNLSAPEILIILFLGGGCLATVMMAVLVLVVFVSRRPGPDSTSDHQAALKEENQHLREELARLKKDQQG
jgi:hypothetical protein